MAHISVARFPEPLKYNEKSPTKDPSRVEPGRPKKNTSPSITENTHFRYKEISEVKGRVKKYFENPGSKLRIKQPQKNRRDIIETACKVFFPENPRNMPWGGRAEPAAWTVLKKGRLFGGKSFPFYGQAPVQPVLPGSRTAPADAGGPILVFIIGEGRAWEFGSAPCGWVFALAVDPDARLAGVGRAMLAAMAEQFRGAGVDKMRTMVARDDLLPLRFFRSEWMMAGPYIQLEMDIG